MHARSLAARPLVAASLLLAALALAGPSVAHAARITFGETDWARHDGSVPGLRTGSLAWDCIESSINGRGECAWLQMFPTGARSFVSVRVGQNQSRGDTRYVDLADQTLLRGNRHAYVRVNMSYETWLDASSGWWGAGHAAHEIVLEAEVIGDATRRCSAGRRGYFDAVGDGWATGSEPFTARGDLTLECWITLPTGTRTAMLPQRIRTRIRETGWGSGDWWGGDASADGNLWVADVLVVGTPF